jgi:gliding motility-associated-like protein
MKKIKLIILAIIMSSLTSYGQITVTQTQTPEQLVNNVLTGSGVVISNVTYNYSAPESQNIQTTIGYFNNNGTGFAIPEGVIMATGDVSLAIGPNDSGSETDNNGAANGISDPDLEAIGAADIDNECILEFDFVPSGDTIVFNYIFASEEFPEWSPSSYNDVFGFFISGPGFAGPFTNGAENIAIIPGTSTPVTINNINPTTNASLYVSNTNGNDLQYDGHTIVLQASASVECGETYHIKLAIGDAGDQSFDSAVFLEANSFASNGVDVQIASATGSAAITEACDSAIVTFIRPEEDIATDLTINYGVGGTATNGTDYTMLDGVVYFPVGVDTVQFYITPSADALIEGTETVELSVDIVNSCGDIVTTTATVEIIDPSLFNVISTDVAIDCPTDSIEIQVSTDGGIPSLNYTWQTDGSTESSLWVPALIDGSVNYVVDVVDACGVTAQGTVNVTVTAAPVPTLTKNPPFATICPGESQVFEVVAINNSYDPGNETYNWFPQPSTSSSVTVAPNVTTWYYVEVFDGCYEVLDSVKATMGNAELTAINTVDALNCPGQAAPSLGEIEILPSVGGWNYTITGAGVTTGPQLGNTFTGLTGGITYFIHVEDADGCAVDTSVLVDNDFTQVEADWILSALDSVTCFGDQDGTAEIQNISGGLNNGPFNIFWTSQTGESSSVGAVTGGGDAVDTLYGGDWVVTVVENTSGCAWSQVFEVYEPSELAITFSSSEPSCFGLDDGDLTVQINGGNTITSAVLTNSNDEVDPDFGPSSLTANSLETDTYTVVVVDLKGCANTESILLEQPEEIAIDFTLSNPLCYNSETGVVFIDTVYNYQGVLYDSLIYYWVPDPNSNSGYGEDDGNNLRFVPEGEYQLKITDGNACEKLFDFVIEYPDSIYFDELGFDYAICRNQIPFDNGQGQVYAAAAGGSDGNGSGTNFTYQWTEELTGSTTTNSTWGNRNPGQFTIVATNDLGCQISETIYLDSLSPIAAFELTSDDFYAPYEGTAVVDVQLVNISSNYAFSEDPSADTTFIWSFGREGDTTYYSSDINEIINEQYLSEGVYEVCLVVIENLNGCSDTACQEVIIHDFPTLVTPNVFTPGGDDEINNYFFFPNTGIEEFSCSVFDRWGKQVFEFTSISDKWDGTNMNNGRMCTDGVYFYLYDGVSTDSTEFKGQGNVHLILK